VKRAVLVAALIAGCGGGGLVVPDFGVAAAGDLGQDAADAAADLAVPPVDLTSVPQDLLGGHDLAAQDMAKSPVDCMGVAQCMYSCLGGGNDIDTCYTQCSKTAKPGSAQKWLNAVICGQDYCVGDTDMMTGKCVEVAVPNETGSFELCDPGVTYAQCTATSYVSTSCWPCIEQARNFWFEDSSVDPKNPGPPTGMCSQPTSADCMGANAACSIQFDACRNDP